MTHTHVEQNLAIIFWKSKLDCMFFTFLIHMSNFVIIRYNLLYELQDYILYIILNYKKKKIAI